MALQTIKMLFAAAVWTGILSATLSIAKLPGDWGHTVCGPWGCGPPLQALLAWHLSWLVVLMPAVVLIRRRLSPQTQLRTAIILLGAAGVIMAAVAAHEYLYWLPSTAAFQREHIWHRIGFQIITLVEVPTLSLIPAGLALLWRRSDAVEHSSRTDTGGIHTLMPG